MNAVIIEDECLAATELETLLKEVAPDIKIEVKLDSVADSVKWLKKNRTDLIFMDIHLGDGQSFDIFEQVEIHVPVIFITAYDEYALKAFKYRELLYLKTVRQRGTATGLVEIRYTSFRFSPFPDSLLVCFSGAFSGNRRCQDEICCGAGGRIFYGRREVPYPFYPGWTELYSGSDHKRHRN